MTPEQLAKGFLEAYCTTNSGYLDAEGHLWTLEELCRYFAGVIQHEYVNTYKALEQVIKERDLAQKQFRVYRDSKVEGDKWALEYLKKNYPKE